jgi:hypothetical protein
MGFIADWKAKRSYKRAMAVYDGALTDWQKDIEIFKKITDAFKLAAKGEDAISNQTIQKPGEIVIWRGQGQFHEAARGAGQFVGSSQGFSIPIVAGIRYRVGATRGTYVSGDPIQKYGEVGDVVLTTQRVLFNGMINTKEWLFSKWNGAAASEDETDYIFHVSNRQKTSGVLFSRTEGREFNRFLACAIIAAEYGIPRVLEEVTKNRKELEEDKPVIPPLALDAPKAAD